MTRLTLYPYGFIFSYRNSLKVPDTFKLLKINNEYNFYYDPISTIKYKMDLDDFIIIHGHFTFSNPDSSIDNDELIELLFTAYSNDFNEFLDLLDYLAGRYVIIVGNSNEVKIYNDAVGTRSVYYSLSSYLVSSHVNLIADNQEKIIDSLVEQYNNLPKISSRTPFEDIRSLMPNFSLSFTTKEMERYFPRKENPYINLNHEEKVTLFDRILKKEINYYMNNYSNVVHSLTGGFDSRSSLATCKDYLQDIKFFTYTLSKEDVAKNSKVSTRYEEDKSIVEQFISFLPINHTFLYLKDIKKPVEKDLNYLLSKNSIVQHGRNLIPHYLDFVGNKHTIHVRGNASALLKSPYLSTTEEHGMAFLIKKLISNMHLKKDNSPSEELVATLKKEFLELGYHKDYHGYKGLDLAFWEIRTGRFQTEVFNESDVAFDSLNPINIRALFEIALSFNLEVRKTNFIAEELININIPLLNFFGKNQTLNMYELNKKKNLDLLDRNKVNEIFSIYDEKNRRITDVNKLFDYIYIPESYIKVGNYASYYMVYQENKGFCSFEVINSYSAKKGSGYLVYSIYVNNKKLLSEDISKWKHKNNISIFNLSKGDIIEIRVSALRTAKSASWQKASITKVLNYSEIISEIDENEKILCTSPHSTIKIN